MYDLTCTVWPWKGSNQMLGAKLFRFKWNCDTILPSYSTLLVTLVTLLVTLDITVEHSLFKEISRYQFRVCNDIKSDMVNLDVLSSAVLIKWQIKFVIIYYVIVNLITRHHDWCSTDSLISISSVDIIVFFWKPLLVLTILSMLRCKNGHLHSSGRLTIFYTSSFYLHNILVYSTC